MVDILQEYENKLGIVLRSSAPQSGNINEKYFKMPLREYNLTVNNINQKKSSIIKRKM